MSKVVRVPMAVLCLGTGCRTGGGAAQRLGETGEQVPGSRDPFRAFSDLSAGRGARYWPDSLPCCRYSL